MRYADAQRFGLDAAEIAATVNTAMLGQVALDRARMRSRCQYPRESRSRTHRSHRQAWATCRYAPPTGRMSCFAQVADMRRTRPRLELERDDLRQMVVVTARLEGRDLGSAMREIQATLAAKLDFPRHASSSAACTSSSRNRSGI